MVEVSGDDLTGLLVFLVPFRARLGRDVSVDQLCVRIIERKCCEGEPKEKKHNGEAMRVLHGTINTGTPITFQRPGSAF